VFAVIVNSAIAGETNSLSRSDELIVEGALHFSEGAFDEAIASFSMAIQFDPTNANAIFDRASAYRAKEEFEKSIADYDKYISSKSLFVKLPNSKFLLAILRVSRIFHPA
jgi:tetratricopeptide (TPR) repeat protein